MPNGNGYDTNRIKNKTVSLAVPVCPEVFDRVVRAVMSLDRAHGKTLFSS